MNRETKNNIDFDYNYLPDKFLSEEKSGLVVLIKHNYYSSNSEHGKRLLSSILNYLNEPTTEISSLYIVDTGVYLLQETNDFYEDMVSIIQKTKNICICIDSIEAYISSCENFQNANFADTMLFFEQLIFDKPTFVIE